MPAKPAPDQAAADLEEVARVEGEIRADAAAHTAEQPVLQPEVHDTRDEQRAGGLHEDDVETILEGALDAGDDALAELDAETIAELLELVFWLVSLKRGAHWEMQRDESGRIAKWGEKAAKLSKAQLGFLRRWLPHIITAGLLVYAIQKRRQQDAAPKERRP